MTKKFFLVLTVLCLLIPGAGCSRDIMRTGTEITADERPEPPNMQLTYTAGNETHSETVFHSVFVWEADAEDGTRLRTEAFGEHMHPLKRLAAPRDTVLTLKKADIQGKIEISFPASPDSLLVKRWEDRCIRNPEKYRDEWMPEKVTENTISVPIDGTGYVYEVTAYWPEGQASYAFYLK